MRRRWSRLAVWLADLPLELLVGIGFGVVFIVGIIVKTAIGGSDPMRSHGWGPGWECDATRGGAVTCAKDVKPFKRN